MKGQIIKVSSNIYTVFDGKQEYLCSAKGKIKFKKESIVVGDYVEINGGVIEKIYERTSKFIRPNVSNVEVIVAVIAKSPEPDFLLLDKLLASAFKENVEVILAINKTDLGDELKNKITEEYKDIVSSIIDISAKDNINIESLKVKIKGKLACLAGQSAVGKSSIINTIFSLSLKTGELSEKIERGKHTTTYSTIYINQEYKIIDTPGFANLEADIDENDLAFYYPDFIPYLNDCKYRGCIHINEPGCKIKELVETGKIKKDRYERYIAIFNELKSRRKTYE